MVVFQSQECRIVEAAVLCVDEFVVSTLLKASLIRGNRTVGQDVNIVVSKGEGVTSQLEPRIVLCHGNAVVQCVEKVLIDHIGGRAAVVDTNAGGGGCCGFAGFVETVPLHLVAGAGVEVQAAVGRRTGRGLLQIELASDDGGVLVGPDGNGGVVVAEQGLVDEYGELFSAGAGLHSSAESVKRVVRGVFLRAFADGVCGRLGVTATECFNRNARIKSINGVLAAGRLIGQIGKRAAPEIHPFHLPEGHMADEIAVVGGEQIVVVHGEHSVSEIALVVRQGAACRCVHVGEEGHGPPVVDEERAVGLDNASCGVPVVIPKPCADAAMRVLDDRAVLQLHRSLPLRNLPLGSVAHHLYALPQLVGTGGGERTAVHNELAAGTDD